jgi:prepilin-type N-terminal cleavage/methylation domain-containing protein
VRKSVSGFTLIELVIVIIILGILAATATARYINLRGDSINSVNEATAGALRSAIEVARMKLITTYKTIPESGWIESADPTTANDDLGFWNGNPECIRSDCGPNGDWLNGTIRANDCFNLVKVLLGKNISYLSLVTDSSNSGSFGEGDACVYHNSEDPGYKFRYSITDGTVVTSQP